MASWHAAAAAAVVEGPGFAHTAAVAPGAGQAGVAEAVGFAAVVAAVVAALAVPVCASMCKNSEHAVIESCIC